jgi:hypothetical protein
VPSAPADRHFQAGRPLWWAAGLFVFLAVAVGAYLLFRGPEQAVLPSQQSSGSPSGTTLDEGADSRADDASALLSRLVDALRDGSRADVRALAAPGDRAAAAELAALRRNVHAMGLTDLSMRYVDEDDGRLTDDQQRRYGDRAWVADVQLGWRVDGFDVHDSHREVPLTLLETPHGAAFLSARADVGEATPLWMLQRVDVRRTGRSLVAVAGDGSASRFSGLADQAVADVRKVLPDWRGRLVVEVPGDERQLGRVLGSESGSYGGIAAVTTTVDGSLSPQAPVHIFVNPRVFDPLGTRGSQIVMSHEATHVATGAAVSSMPTWLLEGFADFVALDHVDLPVSVTASQILARVRKSGPPAHLPGKTEFDPENQALGASYESAWLACRLLAERYGEKRLIAFYRASDRDGSTTEAFRDLLGTDQQAFTRAWKGYLRKLAG